MSEIIGDIIGGAIAFILVMGILLAGFMLGESSVCTDIRKYEPALMTSKVYQGRCADEAAHDAPRSDGINN